MGGLSNRKHMPFFGWCLRSIMPRNAFCGISNNKVSGELRCFLHTWLTLHGIHALTGDVLLICPKDDETLRDTSREMKRPEFEEYR